MGYLKQDLQDFASNWLRNELPIRPTDAEYQVMLKRTGGNTSPVGDCFSKLPHAQHPCLAGHAFSRGPLATNCS